jgi:hypothetical protein
VRCFPPRQRIAEDGSFHATCSFAQLARTSGDIRARWHRPRF